MFEKKNGRYQVSIGFKGKRFYLGIFQKYEEAVEARLVGEDIIHNGFLKAYYQWEEKAKVNPEWGRTHPLVFDVEKRGGRLVINARNA